MMDTDTIKSDEQNIKKEIYFCSFSHSENETNLPLFIESEFIDFREDLRKLKDNFDIVINNKKQILEFLSCHEKVFPCLKKAPEEIEKYFEDYKLHLKVIENIEDSNMQLFLEIEVDSSNFEDAIKKMREIDENWFVPKVEVSPTIFNIDISFS